MSAMREQVLRTLRELCGQRCVRSIRRPDDFISTRVLEFAIGGAALATTSEIYSSQRTGAVALDASGAIDRKALVVRHSPVLQKFDPLSPLSIGNGEFAFIAFGLLGQPMEFRSEPASIIPAFPGTEGLAQRRLEAGAAKSSR